MAMSAASRMGRSVRTLLTSSALLAAGATYVNATANIALWVAPTGSDLNPGTQALPFLTIQKALNTAAQYNYQGIFTCTITVANGTYVGGIVLPPLVNYPAPQYPVGGTYPSLVGNAGSRTSVVISSATDSAVKTTTGALWSMNGFQLKSTVGSSGHADLNCLSYSNILINNIDFAGSYDLLSASDHSSIYCVSATLSCSTSACHYVFNVDFYGSIINDAGTFTITNAVTCTTFASVGDHAILGTGTYVNAGNVTGQKFALFNYGFIEYASARSTFPGTTAGAIDLMSSFAGDLGVTLNDTNGNLWADYNVTSAGNWTLTSANGMALTSPSTSSTTIGVTNTSSGGHNFSWGTAGSGGTLGVTVGGGFLLDGVSGNVLYWWDTGADFTWNGAMRWSASTTGNFTAGTPDVGLSRLAAGSLALDTTSIGNKGGMLTLAALCPSPPVGPKTTAYTVDSGAVKDTSIIFNGTASITVTLPSAASFPGRILILKTIAAFTVVSATSNVRPTTSQTAGTAILPGTAGAGALLHSDGTDWVIMMT